MSELKITKIKTMSDKELYLSLSKQYVRDMDKYHDILSKARKGLEQVGLQDGYIDYDYNEKLKTEIDEFLDNYE